MTLTSLEPEHWLSVLTKAVHAATIPFTGIPWGFSSWNPYTSGDARKEKSSVFFHTSGIALRMILAAPLQSALMTRPFEHRYRPRLIREPENDALSSSTPDAGTGSFINNQLLEQCYRHGNKVLVVLCIHVAVLFPEPVLTEHDRAGLMLYAVINDTAADLVALVLYKVSMVSAQTVKIL